MINYNGAGHRPEVEDVWAVPETPKSKFVSHFIAYAQSKKNETNEDDYFDEVWNNVDFSKL